MSPHQHEPHESHDSERLRAYSDAIVSIVATVMAIPLASVSDEETEAGDVFSVLYGRSGQVGCGVFLSCFILVDAP
eukprot:m.171396 g.171396  ORF g.171396 m.171396 type:complete len:76 (-) comp13498_c2_seq1:3794-4021(-)